jgi:hypothetical protein
MVLISVLMECWTYEGSDGEWTKGWYELTPLWNVGRVRGWTVSGGRESIAMGSLLMEWWTGKRMDGQWIKGVDCFHWFLNAMLEGLPSSLQIMPSGPHMEIRDCGDIDTRGRY